jgi:hypothetical protein
MHSQGRQQQYQLPKQKGEEGQLFCAQPPKKEGNSGSSAFPARTKQTKPNKIHY